MQQKLQLRAVRAVFVPEHLRKDIRRVGKNILYYIEKRAFADHVVLVSAGHNAVPVLVEKVRRGGKPRAGNDEHNNAGGISFSAQNRVYRKENEIHRRVLLDAERQQREHREKDIFVAFKRPEHPQQEREQKAVFVDIVESAAHHNGLQKRHRRNARRLCVRQLEVPAQQIRRHGSRSENRRLPDLERHGGREHKIKRQQQIVNRGNMHRKVRQQLVAFACRHGRKALAHIVKHLAEDAEIVVRRVQRNIPQHACRAAHGGKNNDRRYNHKIAFFCCKRIFKVKPARHIIVDEHNDRQHRHTQPDIEIRFALQQHAERVQPERHRQNSSVVRSFSHEIHNGYHDEDRRKDTDEHFQAHTREPF